MPRPAADALLDTAEAEGWSTRVLRAEKKAGQLLAEWEKNKGGRPGENPSVDTRGKTKTLRELGISYDQSSQWQKLAAVPEEEFERGTPEMVAKMGAGAGCRTIVHKRI